jgi:hypothetical protein
MDFIFSEHSSDEIRPLDIEFILDEENKIYAMRESVDRNIRGVQQVGRIFFVYTDPYRKTVNFRVRTKSTARFKRYHIRIVNKTFAPLLMVQNLKNSISIINSLLSSKKGVAFYCAFLERFDSELEMLSYHIDVRQLCRGLMDKIDVNYLIDILLGSTCHVCLSGPLNGVSEYRDVVLGDRLVKMTVHDTDVGEQDLDFGIVGPFILWWDQHDALISGVSESFVVLFKRGNRDEHAHSWGFQKIQVRRTVFSDPYVLSQVDLTIIRSICSVGRSLVLGELKIDFYRPIDLWLQSASPHGIIYVQVLIMLFFQLPLITLRDLDDQSVLRHVMSLYTSGHHHWVNTEVGDDLRFILTDRHPLHLFDDREYLYFSE